MKITPISYNYNKYNVKKNYCITPSFQAKVVVPKISIAEINDRSVGSMQNRLSKMLQFYVEKSSKQKESFVRRTTLSVKNFFTKEKSKLREDYIVSGKIWFVQNNIELFNNIIENEYNKSFRGYDMFKKDVELVNGSIALNRSKVFEKLGAEAEKDLYNYGLEKGALEFIDTHKDFLRFVKIGEKITPQEVVYKPQVIEGSIDKKERTPIVVRRNEKLEEYRTIVETQKPYPSNGSAEEQAAWNRIDERRMSLRRELKNNNISIVLKKEFSLNPLEDIQSKMEYLRNLRSDSFFNMSSQLDVINEYAKYGVRTWINEGTGESFIRNLFTVCSPLESDVTDEHKKVVAEKFIEIAEHTTERDNSGMRDSIKVISIMEDYGKLFDEGLAIRYIELLKKISFQQIDEYSVNNAISHLSEKPSIKQIMQEYHDILQGYPVEDFAGND